MQYYLAPVWSVLYHHYMDFPRLLSLKRMLLLTSFFPCSYRTCTMQKNVKTAVWCRSIPWRWRSHIASHLSSGENISPTPGSIIIMKGRLQQGKENIQNCSFRMTLISLWPSSKSHINTETLQNKQLYSNQDAIYEQTATLIEKESPNAARL